MAEHVFYLAEAHVVGIKSAAEYRIWLLDHSDAKLGEEYLAGQRSIPQEHCLDVNRSFTLDAPGPNGEIDFLEHYRQRPLTLLPLTLPFKGEMRGQVAIHERLWRQVPEIVRPLPPDDRHQDYRLKIVVNVNEQGVEAFFGYHVRVVDLGHQGAHILFYSWTGEVLGSDWFLLSSREFSSKHSMITVGSRRNDEGSLFVSMDYISRVPFLRDAKVPYAGQV